MPSGLYPEALKPIIRHYLAGDRDEAVRLYERLLPLINYENRQCGLRATKAVYKAAGIIGSDFVRHPQATLSAPALSGLMELCQRLDIMALRWGR